MSESRNLYQFAQTLKAFLRANIWRATQADICLESRCERGKQLYVLFIQSKRIVAHDIKYPDYETGADITNNVLYLYIKFKPEAGNSRHLQPRCETVYLSVSLKKNK